MIDDILDKDEWLLFYFFVCLSFGQEYLNYRFNWRKRERGRSQAFHQIIDRSEDQHERDLVVGIKGSGWSGLLEALSHVFHEFIIEKVYANCRLQLIKLVLLE